MDRARDHGNRARGMTDGGADLPRSGARRSLMRAAASTVVAMAFAVGLASATSTASAATFNPSLIVSNEMMRGYYTMSATDIQNFLNERPGPLKSLVTTDHAGVKKKASVIIYEACQAWHINPTVMLTLLQKEQSLLTRTTLATNTLSRAIGAGCPNGSTNRYPGFGNQMWYGARLLDGYGEGKNGSTIPLFRAPYMSVTDIYQSPRVVVKTANLATYKLFIYNPSIGAKTPYGDLSAQSSRLSGNANFWWIHRKYFGDPLVKPAGYHTRAKVTKATQLWNATIGTKRRPSPGKGGVVTVSGPSVTKKGRLYRHVSWGGNRNGGWIRADATKWVY